MQTKKIILFLSVLIISITSCKKDQPKKVTTSKKETEFTISNKKINDSRISLKLNEMQKHHQLMNMRDHLEAVKTIITLLANDKYDKASKTAYTKLGSTTKMRMMCASFGNKKFENLGLEFHKSADKLSKIFKNRNKAESLKALSNTMNYCVQCHATFRQ